MMKMRGRTGFGLMVAAVLVVVSLAATSANAGPGRGSVGLQASVQGNQTDIGVPIWIDSGVVLQPYLSYAYVSDLGSDFGFGFMPRFNLGRGDAVPYVGLKLAMLMFNPSEGDGTTDYIVGPVVGGDYFLSPRFSLGVEAQFNYTISDENSQRFGNPDGKTFNTATAVNAAFYF